MNTETALPEKGRDEQEILKALDEFARNDPDYRGGRIFSLTYHLSDTHEKFITDAGRRFASANGLNPAAFQSLKRMETQIVAAAAGLLHGPDSVTGMMTSGGTESCMLAVKTYRDRARRLRRVRKPEIIIPFTGHVAWLKGAEYLGVRVRRLPETRDHRPDLKRLKKMLGRRTVMVLGSAPEYPRGMIDPIPEMAAIAADAGVPFHVDACVGGFILPFMEMNGETLPAWDFRTPGVTSISADLHKYGYAGKGASLILYRDVELFKDQIFVETDWPGGIFASAGLLGTRPGAAYASAWATLQRIGVEGYRSMARETIATAEALKKGVQAIDGLAIIGHPQGPLFAFRSTDPRLDIFAVGDRLEARGWQVDRVQQPDGIHAMVTMKHAQICQQYLEDLAACVQEVRENPELATKGSAPTYGMMAHVPMRKMVREKVRDIFAGLYLPGGGAVDLSQQPPARGLTGLAERAAGAIANRRARRQRRK